MNKADCSFSSGGASTKNDGMKLLIVTHVRHLQRDGRYFAYAPYVREMNIWAQFADELVVVAPLASGSVSAIEIPYEHPRLSFVEVPAFNLKGIAHLLKTLWQLPALFYRIGVSMRRADHIHLRCPGNMGLLGCMVQVFFPNKKKSAKYAGNWDPASRQPLSYKLQQWILSNTFLTRNMKVMVYGEWKSATKNVVPFFTATYKKAQMMPFQLRDNKTPVRFIFAGMLVPGKNPLYAVKLVEKFMLSGPEAVLDLYGEGPERPALESYIVQNKLGKKMILHGNRDGDTLQEAYRRSHFVLLPSNSEGWPKAVAEGMFWGCVPAVKPVSCLPQMLDYGKRGVLLQMDLDRDAQRLVDLIKDEQGFADMGRAAALWSSAYTVEAFEDEIAKLLVS